jgi:hypothetical protein
MTCYLYGGYMKKIPFIGLMLVSIIAILVFSVPTSLVAAATPVPTATEAPVTGAPQEISGQPQVIHDQVSNIWGPKKQILDGDTLYQGRYERPFDKDMGYLPGTDISLAALFRPGDGWVYLKLRAFKQPKAEDAANYAVELDLDRDGRGDMLIVTSLPASNQWATSTVSVWEDKNKDVDTSDIHTAKKGDGYETKYSDDPEVAYARLSPDNPQDVQIAFKQTLIGGVKGMFIWRTWIFANSWDTKKLPPEDQYTEKEAGVPYYKNADYPLKAVFGIDNTCRAPSGYELFGKSRIKGSCTINQ